MFVISCAFIGVFLFIIGSSGNGLCIIVFLREKFRHRIITPYFIVLLFADSIYLLFRLTKLYHYSQTLFNRDAQSPESCSNTLLARAYRYATQNWPQTLVPLVHSETYMRFSLILMCIMTVQRTTFITRSLKRLVLPAAFSDTHKHKWTFLFILIAFCIAYTFEFAGLTLFCSKANNRDISFEWFNYMTKYMENSTSLLTNTMLDQPKNLKCVNSILTTLREQNQSSSMINKSEICTQEQFVDILSHYFDQHQKPIVNLIQKILHNQTGYPITRNEIRRKFHFHECLFPQDPNFFHRYYNFMYNRMIGFNRHTLILVFGNILPSLITIISNILSLYNVRQLNRLTANFILPCRRRTDDTRRVLLVITVECILAILNSWFSDIFLSLIYCKRKLLADDDCPSFLRQNYEVLVMFDIFNSISNIILHCLCGKHFRNELRSIFRSIYELIKRIWTNICCCYLRIHWRQFYRDQYIAYYASITENDNSNNSNSESIYLEIKPTTRTFQHYCCDCRWYLNREPLVASRQCLSNISKECLKKNHLPFSGHYHSVTQTTQMTNHNSMRLYFPQRQRPQQTEMKSMKKTSCFCF
ncbi:hypothetical protein I4U23_000797 [Adineta vaga]|nr:hypothetical protein I4U23_000797 [Adineta vaga]